MKFLHAILILCLFLLPAHAQFTAKPEPLWEGSVKTEADKQNDAELVEKSIELAGGKRTAAEFATRLGWSEIGKNDPNQAIRRFNQAWLIDMDFADLYWGFAVATHIRGDELPKVERWFNQAKSRIGQNPRLITDHARVLEERKMPERAKPLFEEALSIDPKYQPAHIGMVQVARALGDKELEDKHQKLHDELTQ